MDLNEAIYQRRALRAYTEQPVERATINELLRAAVLAPSGRNEQPWAFGAFQDRSPRRDDSERAALAKSVNLLIPGAD